MTTQKNATTAIADQSARRQRGILFVVSSPSGAGKTTLCRRLMKQYPRLTFSVSYTTRPKRPGEVDGEDYHFVDAARFEQMVEAGDLAEWAQVHGNRYGTARATIDAAIDEGRDVLFDIDWQGGMQLSSKYPDDTVMVFVLPPSMSELARRLRDRGTEAPELVERRLAKAADELTHHGEYDYLITNDALDPAYEELRAVYLAAHCQARRRAWRAINLIDEARAQNQ